MAVDAYSGDAKPRCETTTRNHDAKPRCETTMRNHDAKPRRETRYKNLLYLPTITSTSYEAAKDATAVLKAYYGGGSERA